ncbi:MAG: DNA-binding response OmpR family regulator [Hyphomicrobiaceae bacterium]|jgi:DNA-binding response OmpR family regulator
MSICVRMRSEGYIVTTAGDGAAALICARDSRPDVVLLDLGLPCDGGMSVMERLHGIETLENVPVIILSGQEPVESREKALAAGASGYLQKPPTDIELIATVKAVL